ncbi:hypothetical protein HNQ07_000018 [Deinococcus metalli]|uniref:Uncharacterized protein n=1 Tax=Deinococcus metalli TaxID=1141878 RepID=A0A7W8KAB2_9DEIO|nr:hypothetical protein [Deinococcus metalli]MBB5374574.1 hypothetical protein [Deinococcus metalli]GHF35268.1 hypothetical protein GCM10017781_10220 [Deinococcus metalli]
MTTTPPARTTRPSFDPRRATGSLLLLSGSLALGLTVSWLGSGVGANAQTSAVLPEDTDDAGWAATTQGGWTQAAPDATYSAQPQGWSRGTTRGS